MLYSSFILFQYFVGLLFGFLGGASASLPADICFILSKIIFGGLLCGYLGNIVWFEGSGFYNFIETFSMCCTRVYCALKSLRKCM